MHLYTVEAANLSPYYAEDRKVALVKVYADDEEEAIRKTHLRIVRDNYIVVAVEEVSESNDGMELSSRMLS